MEDRIPGSEGFYFEDDPDRVQEAQPHAHKPLRSNPTTDGVDFPSPHIQVDAHIGDSKGGGHVERKGTLSRNPNY